MADQVSSGDGCWPTPALGSKRQAASGWWGGKWLEAGGQQGGDTACPSIGHVRCCFVVLLGCLPLTDGICDDVLDLVEGIASETVIKLMQEEKVIIDRYGSGKKMYT
jgi:hypothetical protein